MMLRLRDDVSLAPLSAEHADSMYRWMCDPAVRANIGLRAEPSLEKTLAWIASAEADCSIQAFAILVKGEHVGNVVLDKLDTYLNTARLSIYIGEGCSRGKHIGATAVYLAASKGFGDLGLNKLWLTVHVRNHRAINAYTGLGFAVEGVLRDEFILDGERLSVFYMGLLKQEFEGLRVEWCSGE